MKKFLGKVLKGKIISVHAGNNDDLSKEQHESINAVIDVPGEIRTGDEVEIRVYEEPDIRLL